MVCLKKTRYRLELNTSLLIAYKNHFTNLFEGNPFRFGAPVYIETSIHFSKDSFIQDVLRFLIKNGKNFSYNKTRCS